MRCEGAPLARESRSGHSSPSQPTKPNGVRIQLTSVLGHPFEANAGTERQRHELDPDEARVRTKGEGAIVALQCVGHVNGDVVDDRIVEHYKEVSSVREHGDGEGSRSEGETFSHLCSHLTHTEAADCQWWLA